MKRRIVCYGDSNTWGFDCESMGRFDTDTRWTAIAQTLLGDEYTIIEEGLNGRTTVFDDPLDEGLSGIFHLAPCLLSQTPIDLLIIMLGTNDTKQRFSATPENIALGVARLVCKARGLPVWRGTERKILLIAPIIIDAKYADTLCGGDMGADCTEKSRKLPPLLAQVAAENNCVFLDCNDCCVPNHIDYMHLDADSHRALGGVVADTIAALLGNTAATK